MEVVLKLPRSHKMENQATRFDHLIPMKMPLAFAFKNKIGSKVKDTSQQITNSSILLSKTWKRRKRKAEQGPKQRIKEKMYYL